MNKASGELNAGVVVVVAIGILIAFFYYTLWPIIKNNFNHTTQCNKAICEPCPSLNCEFVDCYLRENPNDTFKCVYKG